MAANLPPVAVNVDKFRAGKTATRHTDQAAYDGIIETTRLGDMPDRINALDGSLKLKKPSNKSEQVDEFFRLTEPAIQKPGGGKYHLKFKLPARGAQAPDVFVEASVAKAEQIELALQEHNGVASASVGTRTHSPHISPKFITHSNGSVEKYSAAKAAFADKLAVLQALPKPVSVKMMKDGNIRIRITEKRAWPLPAKTKFEQKLPLPEAIRTAQADNVAGVAEFVNASIRRTQNVAAGLGVQEVADNTARSQHSESGDALAPM